MTMAAFVLDRLLNGKESASFIVVEDALNLSGWPILKEFIARAAADGYVSDFASKPCFRMQTIPSHRADP